MRPVLIVAAAVALGMMAGCGGPSAPEKKQAAQPESAPDVYRVKLETSKGDILVEVRKAWAPEAAERFYLLVTRGFYDGARFFRVVPKFVAQFGINGDPAVQSKWRNAFIMDDPVKTSNKRGTLAFAKTRPNTRTSQVFINLANNKQLDKDGFAPFAQVVSGMEAVDEFYRFYGDVAPRGQGPDQNRIETEGNAYLESRFPRLDFIKKATVAPVADAPAGGK